VVSGTAVEVDNSSKYFFKCLHFHIVFRYVVVSLGIISFVKGYVRCISLWCVSVSDNMEGSLCVL